jgi:glycosyltransferase involved in cell wall biosynthesis
VHILFTLEYPHLPQLASGGQSSTHELAKELLKRGMSISVAANLMCRDLVGLLIETRMKVLGRKFSRDYLPGYPVYRSRTILENADLILREAKPDVVVVTPVRAVRSVAAFQKSNIPVVIYFRDLSELQNHGPLQELKDVKFIANSQFTADRYRQVFGIEATVIPPLFQPERYRTSSSRRNVTMINPHPRKGGDLAIQLAERCPDIPFCFVRSWPLNPTYLAALRQRIAKLPNVTLRKNTANMRSVYGEARVVLVPSQWEEAWGRVASEAHFSGIPVLASRVGGLPESVGPGGVLVDKDAPVECWEAHLRRLWSDEGFYRMISAAALAYAARQELNIDVQLGTFIRVVQQAIQARSSNVVAREGAG